MSWWPDKDINVGDLVWSISWRDHHPQRPGIGTIIKKDAVTRPWPVEPKTRNEYTVLWSSTGQIEEDIFDTMIDPYVDQVMDVVDVPMHLWQQYWRWVKGGIWSDELEPWVERK